MPALLILAVISWLLGSGKSRAKGEEPSIFTALNLPYRRRWSAFSISAVAHVFGILLLVTFSDLFPGDDDFLSRQIASHALVIRLPERIYLAPATGRTFPSTTRLARSPRVSVRRKDLRKYAESGAQAGKIEPPNINLPNTQSSLFAMTPPPLPAPPPPQAEPRKFVLPDLPVHSTANQTLLQAELPPDLPPQVDKRLPQLLFWSADPPKPPDRPIEPGNLTAKLASPKLNSTPRLEAPNRESAVSDLQVASAPKQTPAALPVPPAGNTMPLRVLEPSQNTNGPSSIDPFTGTPVHVLALSPDPAPLTDAMKALFIPAGNQLARLPGTPPLFGIPGLGDASGTGSSGDGSGSAEGVGGAGSGGAELLHSLPGDGHLFGMLSPPGLTGTPLRILHPSNGVFDVVVVQSSTSETFAEGADALSGRPIYTVYLQVGAPREWILQYCVPNMAGPVQTGGLVKLGNPEPVRAPYPMVTVRPPEDWQHGSDYLLIHGFLDESGRFREMRILTSAAPQEPTTEALLQYLGYWEFRPAVLDGRPVKVEVILAVPPDHLS
jgi:hypothetical protein